jgi:hypothetical protein
MPNVVVVVAVAVAVALGNAAAAAHLGRRLFIWCLSPKFARRDCLLQFCPHPCPSKMLRLPPPIWNPMSDVRRLRMTMAIRMGVTPVPNAMPRVATATSIVSLHCCICFVSPRRASTPRSQHRGLPVSCRTQTLNYPHMYPVTKNRQPPCQYPTPTYHSQLYSLALAWPSSASASS